MPIHRLTPKFILDQLRLERTSGTFEAVALLPFEFNVKACVRDGIATWENLQGEPVNGWSFSFLDGAKRVASGRTA